MDSELTDSRNVSRQGRIWGRETLLNQAGLATVRHRPWTADTLRRFLKRHEG